MNLFTKLLTGVRGVVMRHDFEQEAIRLADQLETIAWDSVRRRAGSLSRNEARGYVRARTAQLLAETMQRQNVSGKAAELLGSLTLAELINRLQARLVYAAVSPTYRAAA